MAAGRLRRFLHIERPRGPGDDAGTAGGAEEARFRAVERPRTVPDAAPGAGAHLDRFRPAREIAPELATAADEVVPFIRCAACGADSNRFAARCERCGADLDTAVQHAFEERFRAERRAEAARERAEASAFQAGRERAAEEEARTRRLLGEALAERERERFEREARGWTSGDLGLGGWDARRSWDGGWHDPAPLGLRLLRRIPDPRWRAAVSVAALGALLGLAVHGLASGRPGRSLAVALGLALILLAPRMRRW